MPRGVGEQSRRHAAIAALLRVPRVVLVVNKMDLVGWDAGAFRAIEEQFGDWDGQPLTATSPEIITLARRTG